MPSTTPIVDPLASPPVGPSSASFAWESVADLEVVEFVIPSGSSPFQMTIGADGNVWFSAGTNVGKITPTGSITEFAINEGQGSLGVIGGLMLGADGSVWFTQPGTLEIGMITVDGVVTEVPVSHPSFVIAGSPAAFPHGIVQAVDDSTWITGGFGPDLETNAALMGRLDPTGNLDFVSGAATGSAYAFASGPDGYLWLAGPDTNFPFLLGLDPHLQMTPDGLNFSGAKFFPIPAASSRPTTIVAGSDDALWFTDSINDAIWRMDMAGVYTRFDLPATDGSPHGLAVGADGNLWFTDPQANKIGVMSPTGTFLGEFDLAPNTNPLAIIAGTDGSIWYTAAGTGRIGRIGLPADEPNAAPVAVDDLVETLEDEAAAFDVLANDFDSDPAATLAIVDWTSSTHGTVEWLGGGRFRYTPAGDFAGEDTFAYTISDGQLSASAIVTIAITPVNDAPIRLGGAAGSHSIPEDAGIVSLGLEALVYGVGGGSDEAGQTLTYRIEEVPSAELGTIKHSSSGSRPTEVGDVLTLAELQSLSFEPAVNTHGSGTLRFSITDDGVTDSTPDPRILIETVTIEVRPVNDAPFVVVPGNQEVMKGQTLDFSTATGNAILIGDVDAGDDKIVVTAIASHGTLKLAGLTGVTVLDGGDGEASMTLYGTLSALNLALDGLVHAPDADFVGQASIRIESNDLGYDGEGGPLSASAEFVVSVLAPDATPSLTMTEIKGLFNAKDQYKEGYHSADNEGRIYSNAEYKADDPSAIVWSKNKQYVDITVTIPRDVVLPNGAKIVWTFVDPDDPSNEDKEASEEAKRIFDPNDYKDGKYVGPTGNDNSDKTDGVARLDGAKVWEQLGDYTLANGNETVIKDGVSRVRFNVTDTGGDNFIVKATLVFGKKEQATATTGIMSVWKLINLEYGQLEKVGKDLTPFLKNGLNKSFEKAFLTWKLAEVHTITPPLGESLNPFNPYEKGKLLGFVDKPNKGFFNHAGQPGWFFIASMGDASASEEQKAEVLYEGNARVVVSNFTDADSDDWLKGGTLRFMDDKPPKIGTKAPLHHILITYGDDKKDGMKDDTKRALFEVHSAATNKLTVNRVRYSKFDDPNSDIKKQLIDFGFENGTVVKVKIYGPGIKSLGGISAAQNQGLLKSFFIGRSVIFRSATNRTIVHELVHGLGFAHNDGLLDYKGKEISVMTYSTYWGMDPLTEKLIPRKDVSEKAENRELSAQVLRGIRLTRLEDDDSSKGRLLKVVDALGECSQNPIGQLVQPLIRTCVARSLAMASSLGFCLLPRCTSVVSVTLVAAICLAAPTTIESTDTALLEFEIIWPETFYRELPGLAVMTVYNPNYRLQHDVEAEDFESLPQGRRGPILTEYVSSKFPRFDLDTPRLPLRLGIWNLQGKLLHKADGTGDLRAYRIRVFGCNEEGRLTDYRPIPSAPMWRSPMVTLVGDAQHLVDGLSAGDYRAQVHFFKAIQLGGKECKPILSKRMIPLKVVEIPKTASELLRKSVPAFADELNARQQERSGEPADPSFIFSSSLFTWVNEKIDYAALEKQLPDDIYRGLAIYAFLTDVRKQKSMADADLSLLKKVPEYLNTLCECYRYEVLLARGEKPEAERIAKAIRKDESGYAWRLDEIDKGKGFLKSIRK